MAATSNQEKDFQYKTILLTFGVRRGRKTARVVCNCCFSRWSFVVSCSSYMERIRGTICLAPALITVTDSGGGKYQGCRRCQGILKFFIGTNHGRWSFFDIHRGLVSWAYSITTLFNQSHNLKLMSRGFQKTATVCLIDSV